MIFKYVFVILYFLENIKYGMLKSDRSSTKNQNNCKDDNNQHFKYSQENNLYLGKIRSASESYEPCITTNCSCHASVIEQDLSPFKEGISKKMIDDVQTRGTKYQIVNHKLFRQKECMFPSRCKGVEHFIVPWLNTLPDMELIVNVRDWPQVNRQWGIQGPVFSFSKTLDNLDIMYPTWGFWEGGPAISLYPTGLGRWDMHRISLMKASKNYPWSAKEPVGFFRGSRTSSERDRLVLLSRSKPNLVDAQFTKNQAWKSPNDTLNMEPASEMSLEDHCKYKYLFNFRGVAASFRFKHLFLCKSLVFHVGSDWIEFFYPSLKPWVHYVPVSENATQEDLENILTFFVEHDDIAEGIASRGYEHIRDNLTMKDVHCYWKKLLKKYAKLLKFKIIKDVDLIEIRSTS